MIIVDTALAKRPPQATRSRSAWWAPVTWRAASRCRSSPPCRASAWSRSRIALWPRRSAPTATPASSGRAGRSVGRTRTRRFATSATPVTDDPMSAVPGRRDRGRDRNHRRRRVRHPCRVRGNSQRQALILMNAEVDASVGPMLKVYADRAGVVYTYTDGDEPGVAMNLFRFVESMGYKPVLMGQIKGFLNRYRNPGDAERVCREARAEAGDGGFVCRRLEARARSGDHGQRRPASCRRCAACMAMPART